MEDLPGPIPPHDAHIHTVLSDGENGVPDLVRAAEAVGLDSIAITDHADASTANLQARAREIERINGSGPVTVLAGAELTILDARGRLSVPSGLDTVHLVLAGLGMKTEGIATNVPADRTRLLDHIFGAYQAAIEGGHVDVVANPLNLGRFPAPVSPDELPRAHLRDLARLMADRDVMFELSATAWWWHPDLEMAEFMRQWAGVLRVFAAMEVRFIAGTNAHSARAVGNNHFTRRMMRVAGIELSQVVDLRELAGRRRKR